MIDNKNFIVAVPARYASTRLNAKPLALVAGEPMIVRVCKQALQSRASAVVACIDDERVLSVLEPLKQAEPRLQICMTSQNPRSGTERIAEMIKQNSFDAETIVVNVQGDEPLITKEHIEACADLISNTVADMSTLCAPIDKLEDVFDPNCVKVVMDQSNFALYFSRAPIPYERDNFRQGLDKVTSLTTTHYHHIGVYGYRVRTILDYLSREPSKLEEAESLEQLRLLHYGMKIAVAITNNPPETGVDTENDLRRVNEILAKRQ